MSFAQDEFIETSFKLSKENDTEMKKHMKVYKTFELNVKDLKKLLRTKKGLDTPTEFILIVDGEKTKFTLFENDILDDEYVEYQDGKIVGKKGEINTYAGYVNDHPQNALRLYVNDDRISGFFQKDGTSYDIGHLIDYGINNKVKNNNKSQLFVAKTDEIFSTLGNSVCGVESINRNAKLAAITAAQNCANTPACKFIKLAIETDKEFANNFYSPVGSGFGFSSGVNNVIIDMVNRADLAFYNSFSIRLKINVINSYPNTNDTYTATGSGIYTEFTNSSFVANNSASNVCHLISGRNFGGNSGSSYIYGQANQGTLCNTGSLLKPLSISSISCNGTCKETTTNYVKYSDAYLIMAHEIAHVIGADHDNSGSLPKTIMVSGEGKTPVFTSTNLQEIINNYCVKTCLNNNIVNSSFTNRLKLSLNNNPINSTPVFINRNSKVVSIPPDNNPLISLNPSTTSFSYSNSGVSVLYSTNVSTSFAMTSPINSFTLNVSAQDKCLSYYWGVPFTYSPSGAKMAAAYPNPSKSMITIEPLESEHFEITDVKYIKVFNERNLEETTDAQVTLKTIKLNTATLNPGIKYIKLYLKNGEVLTQRILVNHE